MDRIMLFLLAIPILVYILRAVLKKNDAFTKTARISRSIFVSLAGLLSVLIVIGKYNYYLIGYRSTSIVYVMATIAGIVYALTDRRFILNSVKRLLLNLIAVILMMGFSFLVVDMIDTFNKQLIYQDNRFRLESMQWKPIAMCGLPVLFVKKGVLERKCKLMSPDTCISRQNISQIIIREIKGIDSGYLVSYFIPPDSNNANSGNFFALYSKP